MRTRGRGGAGARWRVPAMVAALLLVLAACSDGAGGGLQLETGTGPLPPATFTSLTDPDVTVATADWEGTPTVVNFWATWCTFCLEEMPALQAASDRLDGRVRFVGIDRQDPRDQALAFLEETGVTYDQVASPDGSYYVELGARGMPTTLFVDEEGVVAYRHTGPLDEERTLALVEEHLGVTP